MTFDELHRQWEWKAIFNCPGRFRLITTDRFLSLGVLLNDPDCPVREYPLTRAHDLVLVVPLQDGGIISYKRKDGTIKHTLNTPSGFFRKLSQLGIEDVQLQAS